MHTPWHKDPFTPAPCSAAINFELENYDLATTWYEKAVERGARENAIDRDLHGIFDRTDKAKREEISAVLLREDPVRYKWINMNSAQKQTAKKK
jgi:hypothetical protein